jgi:hypothetical protein
MNYLSLCFVYHNYALGRMVDNRNNLNIPQYLIKRVLTTVLESQPFSAVDVPYIWAASSFKITLKNDKIKNSSETSISFSVINYSCKYSLLGF